MMPQPSTNGKAHAPPPEPRFETETNQESQPGAITKGVYCLRVKRVEPGDNFFVRMLSPTYGGMFTHFYQKRSYYCAGDTCKCPAHSNPQSFTWKGYCAAEMWETTLKLYLPIVLEITERLEQDFRHRFGRGQVWNLFRYAQKKSGEPVMGTLGETQDEKHLPPAFDVFPVLRTMYHWNGPISLQTKNPLPDRVLVIPSQGSAPLALEPTQETLEEAQQFDSFTEEFERRKREFAAKKRK